MIKKIIKILRQNIFWVLLFALTVPSYISLVKPGYFFMQDDMQAFRIFEMDKCIQDLQIPCRWVPDAGYQYGYPEFNYYPPSVYYLGELFHLAGFQFIDAVKILFIGGFIVAALAMFIFLRSFLGQWPALIGSLLYIYAPYRAVDVYVRGALSEFWSLAIFPMIFWSSYQLIIQKKLKYMVWMGISIGALLITHNLMSMIFLPIVGIWILIWVFLQKAWKDIPKLILGCLLGLGLAAFFVLPVLIERPYVHIESMLGGYFDYRQHFVDLNQLFLSNHWGYGSSELGPNDDLSLSTGNVLWIGALIGLAISLITFKKNRKYFLICAAIAGIDAIVLFMTHQKSSFVWEKLSVLWWMQFPWRLLADSIFLLSLLTALGIFLANLKWGKKVSIGLGIILVVAAFFLHGSFFTGKEWYGITDKDKFSGSYWDKELTISIFDYLPIYAKLPPNHIAPDLPEILDGKAQFLSYHKGSNFQTGQVNVDNTATIRFPLFDFPGMQVLMDGKMIAHNHSDCRNEEYCLGLITTQIPPGLHDLDIKLTDTPIRWMGNVVTLISLLIIIGLTVFGIRKSKVKC